MDVKDVKEILTQQAFIVLEEKRLPNDTGWQLRLKSGQYVNVFDKGTFNVQGKDATVIKGMLTGARTSPPGGCHNRNAFVVYGHDVQAKEQLEVMLRRWNINPIFLDQLPSEGQTIIEKLEKYRSQAGFAVVLATPDDEGHTAGQSCNKAFRARQNVVLELGMMLALLGRQRIAILIKEHEKMGACAEWRELKPRIALSCAAHCEAGSSDHTPLAGVFSPVVRSGRAGREFCWTGSRRGSS